MSKNGEINKFNLYPFCSQLYCKMSLCYNEQNPGRVKMKGIMVYIILMILSSCASKNPQYPPQDKNPEIQAYLEKNAIPFDMSDQDDFEKAAAQAFPDMIGHKVVFSGESHGMDINYDLELAFIQYLYKNNNMRNLLVELPLSFNYDLREYMKSGAEEILDIIMSRLKYTSIWSTGYKAYLKKLYQFNSTLPDQEKLNFFCLDIENDLNQSLTVLTRLESFKKYAALPEISNYLISLSNRLDTTNVIHLMKMCEAIKSQFSPGDSEFFRNLVDNILFSRSVNQAEMFKKMFDREEFIYSNFIRTAPQDNKGSYYGEWGADHTFRYKQMNYKNSLASLIHYTKDTPFYKSVYTILYIYPHSVVMGKDYKTNSNENYFRYKNQKIDYYPYINPGRIKSPSLVPVDKAQSPYQKYQIFPMYYISGQPSTKFFQGLVIVNKAKASRPLDSSYYKWINVDEK